MRILLFISFLTLSACLPQESKPTSSSLHIAAGDILVSSSILDSVLQFDKDGNYKRVLWRTVLATETIAGLGWMHTTNELLITVDGTPDRVVAVSVIDGGERVLVNNTNITGNMRTSTQLLNSRDIIISETTSLERTDQDGNRLTYAGWPHTNVAIITNSQDITALQDGGFAVASSTLGVRLFPDTTTAIAASATVAAPAGTTAAYGVRELSNGTFLVSWDGAATDYISLYSSSLTLDRHVMINNQAVLAAPRGVDIKKNGNFLVADNTFDYVLEITPSGTVVQRIGLGFLDAPYHVLVVPDFSP